MTTSRKGAASAALVFFANTLAFAALADPSQALALAKSQFAANDCRGAVRTLGEAMPQASAVVAKERDAALAAIHFFTALAHSNCSQKDRAKSHLREFFKLHPGHSSLDASKYGHDFVALFDDVQRAVSTGEMFERFYPGFDEWRGETAQNTLSLVLWASSPAFQILAIDAEREEWAHLRDDDARAAFVERFWQKRDPNPYTEENEVRDAVARRIAFADRFFAIQDEPIGSMSDRGRVFVLLGPPSRVHRRALQRYETTIVQERTRTPLTGTLERWVYFQGELPKVGVKQIEFVFITQSGYGEYVMQRDPWPLKALAAARDPLR